MTVRMQSWYWDGKCLGRGSVGVKPSWAWQMMRGRESLMGMEKSCDGKPAWVQKLQSSPRWRRGAGQPLGRNGRCPRSPTDRPTLQPPWQVQQPAPAPPGAAALLASPAPQISPQRPFSHRGFPQTASAASADAKLPLRRPSRAANGGCLAAALPPRSDGAALAAPPGTHPPLRAAPGHRLARGAGGPGAGAAAPRRGAAGTWGAPPTRGAPPAAWAAPRRGAAPCCGAAPPHRSSLGPRLPVGTARGDGDGAAPGSPLAGARGRAPWGAPAPRRHLPAAGPCPPRPPTPPRPGASAAGAGAPRAPHPDQQPGAAAGALRPRRGAQRGPGAPAARPHSPRACPGSNDRQHPDGDARR